MSIAHGTIAFDTLTTSDQVKSGTEKSIDTSYLFNGSAKAWVDADDSAGRSNQFNISSGTEPSAGTYTYGFANNMGSVNYAVPTGGAYAALQGISYQSTRQCQLKSFSRADSLTADDEVHFFAIFGDLA